MPAHLEQLADRARGYVEAASSANTRRAYASDWKHFSAWCRRQGFEVLPPSPQTVGLYITALASGAATADRKPNSVATIERRLSALGWHYAQRGTPLDRKDCHIATVLASIRNTHASPPRQKEAVLPENIVAMLETLDRGSLRGLRDRAMLLIGFAGGLRRSEIERALKFVGHSLRAGLASSAEVEERYVQKQLGHASAEMTRRYPRRRDRFRVNLTKAAGL